MIGTVKWVFLGLGLILSAHAHAQGSVNHIVVQEEQQSSSERPQKPQEARKAQKPLVPRAYRDSRIERHGAEQGEKEKGDTFKRVWDKYKNIAAGLPAQDDIKQGQKGQMEKAQPAEESTPEMPGITPPDPYQMGKQSKGGLRQIISPAPQKLEHGNETAK